MFNNKKVLGMTGPSVFSPQIQDMVEKFYNSIPLYIGQNKKEDLELPLDTIDGLVLSGGNDIFPGTYHRPVTYGDGLTKFDIQRDKRELYLIKRCVELNKPILAICRGFQLVCVKYGFSLMTNITGCEIIHSPGEIKINLEVGEFMHYIDVVNKVNDFKFQADRYPCNSFHHQSIYADGPAWLESNGMNVIATADTSTVKKNNTRIAEIVEHTQDKIVGCQFHPEASWEYGCVASLLVLNRFKEILG